MNWKAHIFKAKKKKKVSMGIMVLNLDAYIAHQVSENFQFYTLLSM